MGQGDRFRRKALRRGYKVDEVDDFLERAEATLAGEPVNPPLTADDIRDVVFRTRFGGYDEWQVDLHLDRLERELEDFAAGTAPRGSNGFPSRDDIGFPGRDDVGVTAQIPRVQNDRGPEQQVPLPPVPQAPPPSPLPPPPPPLPPAGMPGGPIPGGGMPQRPSGPQPPVPQPVAYGDSFADSLPPPMPIGYDAYAGRHGKADMTVELPTMGGGFVSPFTNEDKARVAELRAGFKPRRFGSGYDSNQVERLFEAILAMMDGRGSTRVSDSDLDPAQFPLVQGGYFEDEVESALGEVRALFSRRMG
jgi:DivIVA domain-containing protein